jgi:tetratricopeptide (TPR) repeat protein
MPARNYMVVDPRRDHSFRVPRPDLTERIGAPDACTGCHHDQDAPWAASAIARWYGPKRVSTWNFAEAIAAGRARAPRAEDQLSRLAADRTQPAIARATALELLRGYGPEATKAIASQAGDPDPLVRVKAVAGLDVLPPADRLLAAASLLSDPVRAVRLQAARILAPVPEDWFGPAQRAAFENAAEEFRAAQQAIADTPEGRFNLAVFEQAQGNHEAAEELYRAALDIEPGFHPAILNLAQLQSEAGRNEQAERILRSGLEDHPEEGDLHYSLGLLLAEQDRLGEALNHLSKAATVFPLRPRVHYNYALALQHLGRREEAEAELRKAYDLDRRDAAILQALVIFYMQRQHWQQALPFARDLAELAPEASEARRLLDEIEREASRLPER